jgi:hypothetical protein
LDVDWFYPLVLAALFAKRVYVRTCCPPTPLAARSAVTAGGCIQHCYSVKHAEMINVEA